MKIKNEAFIINLDRHKSIGTRWITLYVNTKTDFHSLGVELVPKEKKLNKSIITKTQAYDSKFSGCFCTRFIDFMLKSKNLFGATQHKVSFITIWSSQRTQHYHPLI